MQHGSCVARKIESAAAGGAFGPEGGLLAIPAYLVGVLVLYAIYGTSRWGAQAQYFPALASAL